MELEKLLVEEKASIYCNTNGTTGKRKVLNLTSFRMLVLAVAFICYGIYQKPAKKSVVCIAKILKAEVSEAEILIFTSKPNNPNFNLQQQILSFAMGFLRSAYLEADSSKSGFDCSGFVHFVFQDFRVEVPRSPLGYTHFGK
jgi:hypothetical protein